MSSSFNILMEILGLKQLIQASSSQDTWNLCTQEIFDPRYLISDFKIRWIANDFEDNEHAYVNLLTLTKQTNQSVNYEQELEVQWENVDFD